MNIDNLIKFLEKVRLQQGNIDVVAGSFCGSNNGFVAFEIEDKSDDFFVDDAITGDGDLSLSLVLRNVDKIKEDIVGMENLGYTYYRSQFVENGRYPKSGISTCEWHCPW